MGRALSASSTMPPSTRLPTLRRARTARSRTIRRNSFDRVMSVNVKGAFLCCQVFGAAMAKAGAGSIVNIGSIYGILSPDQALYQYRRERGETFFKPVAYSVSKSALMNLTRYLAVYWGLEERAREHARVRRRLR